MNLSSLNQNQAKVRAFIHEQPLHAKKLIQRLFTEDEEASDDILYNWLLWARDEQLIELPDDKDTVLLLCGRGWGKTQWLSESIIEYCLEVPGNRAMLMAADYDNLYNANFMGPAGIISLLSPTIREEIKQEGGFNKSKLTLQFPNGSFIFSRSAEAYDKTRSGEAGALFIDELAAWQYPEEGFDAAQAVLRSGGKTKTLIATTPRPLPLIKKLAKDAKVHLVTGTTHDNYFLSPEYVERLKRRFSERMFRQECLAEILDDNPFALFKRVDIDSARISVGEIARLKNRLTQIVVAVDPSGGKGENHDDVGIVVCGRDKEGHGYILEDATFNASPKEWGERAVQLYHKWEANKILAEKNFGGEMVVHTITTIDSTVATETCNASRAKDIRAEPISALYEQHKIHHVGAFPPLEDEMCMFDPKDKKQKSPNRLDAMVWGIKDLLLQPTLDFFTMT